MYEIKCKKCDKKTTYKSKIRYEKVLKYSLCLKCNFEKKMLIKLTSLEIQQYYSTKIRKCPECKKDIQYKNSGSYLNGIIKNTVCTSCSISGEKNPFYGKKHTKKSKEKISNSVSKNPNKSMTGKTVYGQWLKKYGKEIADQKMLDLRTKQSKKLSGKNNPMFGKPSPLGSGNGWSGWYKGWFFRSLLELSYMINVIERFNLKWESAESKKYKITYKDNSGNLKNYFPDFIINNKYVVECKPTKMMNSENVQRKAKSAIKHCKKNGLIYKLTNVSKLTKDEIKKLYLNGLIKFTNRYEKKMKSLLDLQI